MKYLKYVVFCGLAATALTASAQFTNSGGSRFSGSSVIVNNTDSYNRIYLDYANMGVNVELDTDNLDDYESVKWIEDDLNKNAPSLHGFKIGYTRGISVTKKFPLFIEVGGNLQYNRSNVGLAYYFLYDGELSDVFDCQFLSIGIPVNIAYKLSFTNGMYIEPYAGIGVKINVLGNEKLTREDWDSEYYYTTEIEQEMNYFDAVDTYDHPLNRFQFGGQVGIHLGYKFFDVHFGSEFFTPLTHFNDRHWSYKFKNNCFHVGVGFNF